MQPCRYPSERCSSLSLLAGPGAVRVVVRVFRVIRVVLVRAFRIVRVTAPARLSPHPTPRRRRHRPAMRIRALSESLLARLSPRPRRVAGPRRVSPCAPGRRMPRHARRTTTGRRIGPVFAGCCPTVASASGRAARHRGFPGGRGAGPRLATLGSGSTARERAGRAVRRPRRGLTSGSFASARLCGDPSQRGTRGGQEWGEAMRGQAERDERAGSGGRGLGN